jgi:hypothetical protein
MVRFPTLVLGATLGLAALGLSATASADPEFAAYHPGPHYAPHSGPRVYGGAPFHRNFGPAYGYRHGPVDRWHAGYAFRDGHVWRR